MCMLSVQQIPSLFEIGFSKPLPPYLQELLPPKFESSSESSDSEVGYPGEGPLGFDDPWSLGGLEVPEKLDMSDLWVTEDTMPLTDSKPGKKYSFHK